MPCTTTSAVAVCAPSLGGDRGLAVVDRGHDAVSDRGDLGIA